MCQGFNNKGEMWIGFWKVVDKSVGGGLASGPGFLVFRILNDNTVANCLLLLLFITSMCISTADPLVYLYPFPPEIKPTSFFYF